jgi:ubiquinone/menaquinone biosynthesis C-methylase UbiE
VDLRILKDVNDLWSKLGPFAGGISVELARRYPGLKITLAAQESGMVDFLRTEIEGAKPDREMELRCCELDNLAFADSLFDLVIFRGAYFFLDEESKIIREIYRVLKEDGTAFIGGGYGKATPQALIDEIAHESRDLNDRLGRRRVTVGEVKGMVKKAGLSDHGRIEREGGLWLVIKK